MGQASSQGAILSTDAQHISGLTRVRNARGDILSSPWLSSKSPGYVSFTLSAPTGQLPMQFLLHEVLVRSSKDFLSPTAALGSKWYSPS
jgi:hypothetical protein